MFKALLVDDEKPILDMLARVLEKGGFKVATSNSAAGGMAMLGGGEAFDIVITDLRMESPVAGFDVARAAARAVPRPVIVILTAFPVPASDWKHTGADALFVKGANTRALPGQLRELLQERSSLKGRLEQEP